MSLGPKGTTSPCTCGRTGKWRPGLQGLSTTTPVPPMPPAPGGSFPGSWWAPATRRPTAWPTAPKWRSSHRGRYRPLGGAPQGRWWAEGAQGCAPLTLPSPAGSLLLPGPRGGARAFCRQPQHLCRPQVGGHCTPGGGGVSTSVPQPSPTCSREVNRGQGKRGFTWQPFCTRVSVLLEVTGPLSYAALLGLWVLSPVYHFPGGPVSSGTRRRPSVLQGFVLPRWAWGGGNVLIWNLLASFRPQGLFPGWLDCPPD